MENQLKSGSLPPPPPKPPEPPNRPRSIPEVALRLLGATTLLILGALLLTRLYFSDERIRSLLEEQLGSTLNTPVHIKGLKLSLLSSMELEEVKITAPEGLTQPPLTFERFRITWSLAPLLSRKILIKQILLKNPHLVYEKNAHTDTLTALTAGFPPTAPSPVNQEPRPLQQPRFPVELELSSLAVLGGTLSAHTPELSARVPDLSLHTLLWAYQDNFSINARGELGSSHTPSPITVTQPLATASLQTHGAVHIESRGFEDTRVSVTLNSQNHASQVNGPPLPPIPLSGQIELQVNLAEGSLHLSTFDWRVGQETALKIQAQAHNLQKEPTVSVKVLEATSNLKELTPFAHLADPTLQLQGQLRVTADPLELSAHSLGSPTTVPINLPFSLTGFSVEKPPFSIHDLTVEGNLTSKNGHLTLESKAHIKTVGDGVQTLEDITTTLHSTTPALPWLAPNAPLANPTLNTRLHTSVAAIKSPAGTTRNTRINAEATIPVAVIQSTPHGPPLNARVTVDTDTIRSDGFSAPSAHLTLDAAATDLQGTGATATVSARVLHPRLRLPDGQIPLPLITFALNATREEERLHIQKATVNLRSLAHLQCSAEIEALTSLSPLVTKTSCHTNDIDLKKVLNQIPPPLKPLTTLSGSAQFSLALGGRLNPAHLIKDLPPPPPSPSPDWERDLSSQFNHALQWVERLKRGFPFTLSLRGDLSDVSATAGATLLSNLKGFFAFTLPGRTPSLEMEFRAETVEQNELLVINPKQRLTLSLKQDTLHVQNNLTFKEATGPVLPKSLQNGTALLEGAYQFGGDLRLDTIHLDATGVPMNIDVSAVISDPLQPLLKRAWLDERLPAVNAEFKGTSWVNFDPPLSLPALDARVAGKMSFSTQGTIADGLISLRLLPQFKNLNLSNQDSRITNLSGSFPFQLDLSFDELPRSALVARDLTPGLEKLWLKTSGGDIRLNTAAAIFQERLKPYEPNSSITIEQITHQRHEIRDFSLQGQLKDGVLHAKEISMHLLGGDIIGEAGVQINHERSLLGSFRFQASNLDASYFKALQLKPGPSSELSTNFNTQFLIGRNERNLEADMNVTKIGSKTLDRFLQLLDPNELDPALQKYRKYLWLVTVDEVAVWVRHENLNMDLLYSTLLRVPGTQLGFRPIDREMIRRFSLSELVIDPTIDKHITPYVGPFLGWTTR